MADKQKVKITLLGVMKEYEIEVDDKKKFMKEIEALMKDCLLYTSPSPRDRQKSRMPSSA